MKAKTKFDTILAAIPAPYLLAVVWFVISSVSLTTAFGVASIFSLLGVIYAMFGFDFESTDEVNRPH